MLRDSAPPPKTIGEVADEVTTLQKLLNSTVGRIENLTQGIGDLAGKIETEAADRLKGLLDLETRIIGVLSKEISDRVKAVDGIWDKLEGWLIERIIGILLKALDREVKEMK